MSGRPLLELSGRPLSIVVALLLGACGGRIEDAVPVDPPDEPEPQDAPIEETVDAHEPEEPSGVIWINAVTPEMSGYEWAGAPSPFSYQLEGSYVVEFEGTGHGWDCATEVDGASTALDGALLQDALVQISGCPFSVTFWHVD